MGIMKTTGDSTGAPSSETNRPRPAWRFWSSWGLVTRLSVTIGLLVLAVAMLDSALTLKGDAERARAHHTLEAAEVLGLLAPVVADLAVIGDYASITQRLDTIAMTREDIEWLRWADARGNIIASSSNSPHTAVPSRFAALANIPPHEESIPIILGSKNYGTLGIRVTPAPALAVLWDSFTTRALNTAIVVAILLAIIPLLLKGHLKALRQLASAMERFRSGETAVRVEPSGMPEAVAMGKSFNRMANQITELLDSLSHSRAELREQLRFT